MSSLMLGNGWEVGFSRDVLVETLENGANNVDTDLNVAFASDAAEAAKFVRADLEDLVEGWTGSADSLAFVTTFANRF